MTFNARRLASYIQRLYPRELAGSWDNTGVLLEPSFTRKTNVPRILLCIDLTTAVCQEAITKECAHIITYHPIIFGGIKTLTLTNTQQRSLLRLASAGISIYSPHTSVDAVRGGVIDVLAAAVSDSNDITVVEACKNVPSGFEGSGYGRIVNLSEDIEIDALTQRVKQRLGLSHVQLARASSPADHLRTVALCAGSGGSVLKHCEVDVILTGELSHHDILAFTERGTHVILCGHDNTERPYLNTMKQKLGEIIEEDHEILVSEADKCPFETI